MKSPELNPGQNPNVLQSSSLNEKGSGTFARTTYPPETLPKTSAPDGIPTETSKKPEINNQDKQKKALRQKIALILGGVVAVMGVGYAADQVYNIPAVHQTVDNALGIFGLIETPVPPIFDKQATQGVIGPANSVLVTGQEYEKVAPPVIEGDNVNIPIPFSIKSKNGEISKIQYNLTKGTISIPRTILKEGVKQQIEVNDAIVFSGLKEGNILLSPISGKIYHSRAQRDLNNPNGGEWGFTIKGYDENGNITTLRIETVALKPLIDTPRLEDYKNSAELTPVDIKIGDSIGEILTSSNNRLFSGQVRISTVSGIKESDGTYTGGPANARISTNPDQKAFVLQ